MRRGGRAPGGRRRGAVEGLEGGEGGLQLPLAVLHLQRAVTLGYFTNLVVTETEEWRRRAATQRAQDQHLHASAAEVSAENIA